ncbi:hypothetical protein SNEBB_006163 [Seison nebaliae]|nr:hypothetical protein SNEBB_006163 [Seison nebaliae]
MLHSNKFLNKISKSNYLKRFASTLIVGEHDNKELKSATLNGITAAQQIGDKKYDLLLCGWEDSTLQLAEQCKKIKNVEKVFVEISKKFEGGNSESMSQSIFELQNKMKYENILAGSSVYSKSILPRTAAMLDIQPMSDVVEIVDKETFKRFIYAGNVLLQVKANDAIKIFTVRTTSFNPPTSDEMEEGNGEIEQMESEEVNNRTQFVSQELTKSDRPDLNSAEIIVSGGRGMKNGDNFEMLYKLADKLNAGVGASRAAVDAGFVPNDLQIGQTGKIVAPQLYVAFGISGAIQHLAGMKDSKKIVAVNTDEEAPIFQVADYGLVADLFKVIPELQKKL